MAGGLLSTNPYAPAYRRPEAAYDARAVASLLLLGTLVAAPVSIVLGVIGIRATRHGVARGRWCAVLGVVGGVALTLLLVGGLCARPWIQRELYPLSGLAEGDCADVGSSANGDVLFEERPCHERHDAEVVHRGTLDELLVRRLRHESARTVCTPLVDDRYASEFRSGDYLLSVVVIGASPEPRAGQDFLCVSRPVDGEQAQHGLGANV